MFLITPSLLNSWNYYINFDAEDSEEKTAEQKEAECRADFLRTLRREKSVPSEDMQKGIDFEEQVHDYCCGHDTDSTIVREIGDIVKGGLWQQAVKKELGDFLLYARIDVTKADTLFDIKRTGTYEVGKYQGSAQHRIEFYCTGLPKFRYLISDERSWWAEDYFNHDGIEQELRYMLHNFTGYLDNDHEALELYNTLWESK